MLFLSSLCPCAPQDLRAHADDPAFQQRWQEVKQQAKVKSIERIEQLTGLQLPKQSMLDVQVKRIHEVRRWGGVGWRPFGSGLLLLFVKCCGWRRAAEARTWACNPHLAHPGVCQCQQPSPRTPPAAHPPTHLQYKRQLLNVLGIIHRYDRIKRMPAGERGNVVPRICVIGGKVGGGGRLGAYVAQCCREYCSWAELPGHSRTLHLLT